MLERIAPGCDVDRVALDELLTHRPTPEQLSALLADPRPERVRAAVAYLGMFGSVSESPVLALCLHHDDDGVVRLAEQCLWALWMQAGPPDANTDLAVAVASIRDGHLDDALRRLVNLTAREPGFAEAHFQRGLALALAGRDGEAVGCYERALQLNPYHFAAAAALGHASVEQGDLRAAVRYYRRALQIHPRLDGVPQAMQDLQTMLAARR